MSPQETTGRRPDSEMALWCRDTCLELPEATTDQPFGEGADMFRIHRKMFALLTSNPHVDDAMVVNLKMDPEELPLLMSTHDFVIPAFHMNKKHWGSVVLWPGVDRDLVTELIEDSYDAVVAGLPARLRTSLDWGGRRTS